MPPRPKPTICSGAPKVAASRLVPVGLEEDAAGQLIHGVGDLAEESGEPGRPGLGGVGLKHFPVLFELDHAHVPGRADGGYAPGGGEEEDVAVEEGFRVPEDDPGLRPIQNLVQLQLISLTKGLVGVVDPDLGDLVAQELQRRQKRAAHISQAHHGQPEFRFSDRFQKGPDPVLHVGKSGIQRHPGSRKKLCRSSRSEKPLIALCCCQIIRTPYRKESTGEKGVLLHAVNCHIVHGLFSVFGRERAGRLPALQAETSLPCHTERSEESASLVHFYFIFKWQFENTTILHFALCILHFQQGGGTADGRVPSLQAETLRSPSLAPSPSHLAPEGRYRAAFLRMRWKVSMSSAT